MRLARTRANSSKHASLSLAGGRRISQDEPNGLCPRLVKKASPLPPAPMLSASCLLAVGWLPGRARCGWLAGCLAGWPTE